MNRSRYVLALFDDPAWKPGDPDRRKTDPEAGGGRRKPVTQPEPRIRDPRTGQFVSADEFQRALDEAKKREHDLNQENAKRRVENTELKTDIKKLIDAHESVKARAIRTEVLAALTTAKAIDPDVVADAFLRWAGDKVKVGENLAVEGLTTDIVSEFAKIKPKLFETAGGSQNGGAPVVIDENALKPNATAISLSPGGGGNPNEAPNVKLDFSKGHVDAILDKYAESLR